MVSLDRGQVSEVARRGPDGQEGAIRELGCWRMFIYGSFRFLLGSALACTAERAWRPSRGPASASVARPLRYWHVAIEIHMVPLASIPELCTLLSCEWIGRGLAAERRPGTRPSAGSRLALPGPPAALMNLPSGIRPVRCATPSWPSAAGSRAFRPGWTASWKSGCVSSVQALWDKSRLPGPNKPGYNTPAAFARAASPASSRSLLCHFSRS